MGTRVHFARDRPHQGRRRRAFRQILPRHGASSTWRPAALGTRERRDQPPGDPRRAAPADTQAERSRQIKDLLNRFSVRQFYNIKAQEYALRLLPHPIDRYADAASGLVDGAIFIYANGTNPEVLLAIEAQRHGKGSPAWRYAAAPLTRAEPALRLGHDVVWTHPCKDVTSPDDTYFLARKPRRMPRPDSKKNETSKPGDSSP